ncbi:DUF2169 domain-containing protein [Polyangium fumosum]|uniref:DUF2169 domain-containing protein n=1 Tax=Polyangium fumosum TaxID=889272 RepID=A0A4V5PN54_9BACT|nr:DUF2169 domain-containing protein [Polyangium fumosum]TKD09561.1 DUF2169 domain-containing protein [Polyangium fumosum]
MKTCNKTPLALSTFSSVDLEDELFQVVIAKGVFDIVPGAPLALASAQEVIGIDEAVPFKIGTDILCQATAYAPGGVPVPSFRVGWSMGASTKHHTVTGPRARVYTPLLGWSLSPIVPVRQAPLGDALAHEGEGYRYLRGDEEVILENLHPEYPRLTFRLPNLLVATALVDRVGFRYGSPLRLDTLSIDVERMRAVLVWRASPPLYKDGVARVDLAMQRRP